MTTTPTTPARVDLRSCPFCGESARFIASDGRFEIDCGDCGVTLPTWHFTEASAASAWNRRAIDRRGGLAIQDLRDAITYLRAMRVTDAMHVAYYPPHGREDMPLADDLADRIEAALGLVAADAALPSPNGSGQAQLKDIK